MKRLISVLTLLMVMAMFSVAQAMPVKITSMKKIANICEEQGSTTGDLGKTLILSKATKKKATKKAAK